MADIKTIKTDVTVEFSDGDISYLDPFVVYEMDDIPDSEQHQNGAVRIRAYSVEHLVAVGDSLQDLRKLVATKGTLIRTSEVRVKRVEGNIEFTGNDRIKLPYPVLNAGVHSGLDNFRAVKSSLFYNPQGAQINPSISLNYTTGELVASQPCYGGMEYAYNTVYRIYRYLPHTKVISSGVLGGVQAGINLYDAIVWDDSDYGMLLAFSRAPTILGKDGTVLGVPPPPITFKIAPPETPNIEFELYRVESIVIVNEDGVWEKPLGWPNDGDYPDIEPEDEIDVTANHLEMKRVHEIAYFSLQDMSIRNANNRSQYMNVPLSFKKLEERAGKVTMIKNNDGTVTYENPTDEYKRNVRDFPIPRMRVVRYERPLEKPYGAAEGETPKWPDPERHVIPVQVTLNGQTIVNYIEQTKEFKIKLTVTPGRAPRNTTSEINAYDAVGADKTALAYRQAAVNNQLYRAWQAIDWQALRQIIRAQYPNWQYAFEPWTFPGESSAS